MFLLQRFANRLLIIIGMVNCLLIFIVR